MKRRLPFPLILLCLCLAANTTLQGDDVAPQQKATLPWSRQIAFLAQALPKEVKLDRLTLRRDAQDRYVMSLDAIMPAATDPAETASKMVAALQNMRTLPSLEKGEVVVESVRRIETTDTASDGIRINICCQFIVK